MLKNIILSMTSIIVLSNAQGFKADISLVDATQQFKVLNIGSLAVGEKGLVRSYMLDTCIDDGIVKVSSFSELDKDYSKYSTYYDVSREANNRLNINFSQKGEKATTKSVENSVFKIINSKNCKELKEENIPLFDIETFLGAKSLKELVSRATTPTIKKEESVSTNQTGDNDISKLPWVVTKDKSPIDDSPTVSMLKMSEDIKHSLVLRCSENHTELFLTTTEFMGVSGSGNKKILIRFDDAKAVRQPISFSTDGTAIFFRSPIKNIKKMMESKKITVRYYPYSGGTKTTVFDLGNLKEEITPLRDACHW